MARKIVVLLLVIGILLATFGTVVHANNSRYAPKRPLWESVYVNSPQDVHYYYGSTGNTITWTIESEGPLAPMYWIFKNETLILHSVGTSMTINIDGLEPGTYQFGISVSSYHGVSLDGDIVMVYVERHPDPMVQWTIENHRFVLVGITSLFVVLGVLVFIGIERSKKKEVSVRLGPVQKQTRS